MSTTYEPVNYSLPMVTAWRCCYRGSNQCKRDLTVGKCPMKCPTCKGMVVTGTYHITTQEWRGDGRYTLERAVRVFRSMAAAEHSTVGTELVVRLLSA